jgi:hypothetical protein
MGRKKVEVWQLYGFGDAPLFLVHTSLVGTLLRWVRMTWGLDWEARDAPLAAL